MGNLISLKNFIQEYRNLISRIENDVKLNKTSDNKVFEEIKEINDKYITSNNDINSNPIDKLELINSINKMIEETNNLFNKVKLKENINHMDYITNSLHLFYSIAHWYGKDSKDTIFWKNLFEQDFIFKLKI